MNDIIKAVSLSKSYRGSNFKVNALADVSFSLREGDFLAVVGPSGSGKSTLLHVLGGILLPDKGEVFYQGKSVYRQKEKQLAFWRNRNIGFVFQFYHLIEELNVWENITLAALSQNKKSALRRARQLLEYLGLENRANFYPSQLSGGQKQKAAVARALINCPSLLFCDEPTGNLDKEAQEKIKQLLIQINEKEKATVVLVTHNLELAKAAKKVIAIESGRLKN